MCAPSALVASSVKLRARRPCVYERPARAQLRADKQKQWDQRFAELLQKREASHSGSNWLESMPKHCVQETRAQGILVGSGLACAGVQIASVYITLSLLLRIPIKGD